MVPIKVGMIIFLVCVFVAADAAKILMLPQNVNSHMIYFARLSAGLADEGHTVTTLAPSSARVPDWLGEKTEVIRYNVRNEKPFTTSEEASQILVAGAFVRTGADRLNVFKQVRKKFDSSFMEECEDLMDNEDMMRQVEMAGYDFAIVDGSALDCLVVLPYKLGIPYATYCVAFAPWLYRVPNLPSVLPSHATDYTHSMTFTQRLKSVMYEFVIGFVLNSTTHYSEKYAVGKPPLSKVQLFQKSSLWFLIRDYTIHYPAPTMPNVIEISDILGSPGKSLPDDLVQILSASRVTVLFSLGSYLGYMPKNITKKFCDAFQKIPLVTILWKSSIPPECELSDNVHVYSWLPQNDLLAHPKVQLFITHAGINSMAEALYHGVPMLALPLFLDQPFNAAFIEYRKVGEKLTIRSFTPDILASSIKRVFQSKTIRDNVKLHSELMKDKPTSAAKRASYWVNHVLKYGDGHLRTAAYDLNVFQFFMFDIFAFIAIVVIISISIITYICYFLSKHCYRKCIKPKRD